MSTRRCCYLLALLTFVALAAGSVSDPDLWGHVRFGQDMIAAHRIALPDIYSFGTDRPWINHEWLSEILMAQAFDAFGPFGLAVLRLALLGGAIALVSLSLDGSVEERIAIACAAILGTFWRALPIRPQLFSVCCISVLLFCISRWESRRNTTPLLAVPPLIALWANLHGGWIVGLGVFTMWAALRMVKATQRERYLLAAVSLSAVAASLVNPYGLGLWRFLFQTVGVGRPAIADWQPLYQLHISLWVPWFIGLCALALGLRNWKSGGRQWLGPAAAFLGILSLRVSRLDAFFALTAIFFYADSRVDARAPHLPATSPAAPRVLRAALVVYALVVFAAVITRVRSIPILSSTVPDRQVATYVLENHLSGRLLTYFDWGEYTIWHFGPALKVSVDGRRETVYTDQYVQNHTRLYSGTADAVHAVQQMDVDYVWLPRGLPVVGALKASGWRTACEGDSSILLSLAPIAQPCRPIAAADVRAFPDL